MTSPNLASSSTGVSSPSRPGGLALVRAMREALSGSGGGGRVRTRNLSMRSLFGRRSMRTLHTPIMPTDSMPVCTDQRNGPISSLKVALSTSCLLPSITRGSVTGIVRRRCLSAGIVRYSEDTDCVTRKFVCFLLSLAITRMPDLITFILFLSSLSKGTQSMSVQGVISLPSYRRQSSPPKVQQPANLSIGVFITP